MRLSSSRSATSPIIALWFAYLCHHAVLLFRRRLRGRPAQQRDVLLEVDAGLSDLKILASKFLAGVTLFPLIIFVIGAAQRPRPPGLMALASNLHSRASRRRPCARCSRASPRSQPFGARLRRAGVLWYAPFLAWVGGLSTIFGRWSLPLAFVIPGLRPSSKTSWRSATARAAATSGRFSRKSPGISGSTTTTTARWSSTPCGSMRKPNLRALPAASTG